MDSNRHINQVYQAYTAEKPNPLCRRSKRKSRLSINFNKMMLTCYSLSITLSYYRCFFLFITAAIISAEVQAASLLSFDGQKPGDKAKIELSPNDDFVINDHVFLVQRDSQNKEKKKALLKIIAIQEKQATAVLIKGKLEAHLPVILATAKKQKGPASTANTNTNTNTNSHTSLSHKKNASRTTAASVSSGPPLPLYPEFVVGAVGGTLIASQSVKLANNAVSYTVPMKGNGLSYKAYANLTVDEEFGLIGRLGIDNLVLKGTGPNVGDACEACFTTISYFTTDLMVRYVFDPGIFNPFGTFGMSLLYPLPSKSSNILKTEEIGPQTIFLLGLGLQVRLRRWFVPLIVEYAYFPPSNQVSTNFLAIRSGLAYSF